ncbi:MAG TPA: NADH-quinone oxidoreductase subunit NuoK [Bdellovibrionota bacterium]|jgi:NADH-quinone oxidoreductase subunit K
MAHTGDPYLFPALITGAALFSIGLAGITLRRSLIAILMCIELMLTGVNLTLVTFARANQDINGQIIVFFIVTVAAAEGAIGLGLLIALYRNMKEIGTAHLNQMKE